MDKNFNFIDEYYEEDNVIATLLETTKKADETAYAVENMAANMERMIDLIKNLTSTIEELTDRNNKLVTYINERTSMIWDCLGNICPEYETLETMSENPKELKQEIRKCLQGDIEDFYFDD